MIINIITITITKLVYHEDDLVVQLAESVFPSCSACLSSPSDFPTGTHDRLRSAEDRPTIKSDHRPAVRWQSDHQVRRSVGDRDASVDRTDDGPGTLGHLHSTTPASTSASTSTSASVQTISIHMTLLISLSVKVVPRLILRVYIFI